MQSDDKLALKRMFRWYNRNMWRGSDDDLCVYCHKQVNPLDLNQLPNFDFKCGKWHSKCVPQFIAENVDRFENSSEIDHIIRTRSRAKKGWSGPIIYKIRSEEFNLKNTPLTV